MGEFKVALTSAIITAISTIVVGALGYAGGYWGVKSTEVEQVAVNREVDVKMIDVALAILAGEKGVDGDKQSIEARRFAVRILRQYSEIEDKRDNEKSINWDKWADDVDVKLQIDRELVKAKRDYSEVLADNPVLLKTDLEALASRSITSIVNKGIQHSRVNEATMPTQPNCGVKCVDELQKRIWELESQLSEPQLKNDN